MMKSVLGVSVVVIALGASAIALAQHRGGDCSLDADGDGVITLEEVKTKSAAQFGRMDTDGNGVIDKADRAERKDGHFARIDSDGSGEVSQAELLAAHQARSQQREERGARVREAMFTRLDTDKSGGISPGEFEAMHTMREGNGGSEHGGKETGGVRGHAGSGRGMHMLGQADANGDSAITRAEFDAAIAAHFARVDKDGSGEISKEEREAAHAAMREQHKN